MKIYRAAETQLHVFLTSSLDGDEWSVTGPNRYNTRERAPGTNYREEWVGHNQSRNYGANKTSCFCHELNPDCSLSYYSQLQRKFLM
jgi:hypothetical protein